jgi:hypothetical protein
MLSLSKSPALSFGAGPGAAPFRRGPLGGIGPAGAKGLLLGRGPFQGPTNGTNASTTSSSSSDDSDDDSDDDNDN